MAAKRISDEKRERIKVDIRANPHFSPKRLADKHGLSDRTIRDIRDEMNITNPIELFNKHWLKPEFDEDNPTMKGS